MDLNGFYNELIALALRATVFELKDFVASFRCTLPIKLSSPVSKYWAEDGQAGHQDAATDEPMQ